MDVLSETGDDASQLMERHTHNMKAANLVINGALVEAKLLIYGKVQRSFLLSLPLNSFSGIMCLQYRIISLVPLEISSCF